MIDKPQTITKEMYFDLLHNTVRQVMTTIKILLQTLSLLMIFDPFLELEVRAKV